MTICDLHHIDHALADERAAFLLNLWADAEDGTDWLPPRSVYQDYTSEINQMGKSNAAVKTARRVSEYLHGRDFPIENIVFSVDDFLTRRREIPEWDLVLGDEIQRVAGNREWQTQENAMIVEELETGSFDHKHVLLTMPHRRRVDVNVEQVLTSQVAMRRVDYRHNISFGRLYYLTRDQLNRSQQEMTWTICDVSYGKVDAPYWHQYLKAKREFYDKRREKSMSKAREIEKESVRVKSDLGPDEIEAWALANEQKVVGKDGMVSATRLLVALKKEYKQEIPWNRVQFGAAQANETIKLKREEKKAEAAS